MKLLNPGLDDMLDAPPDRNVRRRGLLFVVCYLGGWALQNYAAAISNKLAPRPLEALPENGVVMTDAEAGDGRDHPPTVAAAAEPDEYLDIEKCPACPHDNQLHNKWGCYVEGCACGNFELHRDDDGA